MSSGKQTPRQKMINMMYLVLMAMLALNVSVDVLQAFWSMNKTITAASQQWDFTNKAIYDDLLERVKNNPVRYEPVLNAANQITDQSNGFYSAVEDYKVRLLQKADVIDKDQDKIPEEVEVGQLQSTSTASEFFFPGGTYSTEGKQFDELMNGFREKMLSQTKDPLLRQRIENDFSTEKVTNKNWLIARFEHYPLAAVIAMLSQMQSNIRQTQADVVEGMVGETTSGGIVFDAMQAVIIPEATTVMQGGSFKAEVMLAAYDKTQQPEIKLDGGGSVRVENGRGLVTIPSGGLGIHNWGGIIRIKKDDGSIENFPFKGTFDVSAPTAVVSPTQMNVLYRGVDNPISVSVPGVSANSVSIQGPGIQALAGGKYVANVTSVQGANVSYTVVAKMPDGSSRSFTGFNFRIKNVPTPQGQIRGQSQPKLNKSNFAQNKVEVVLPDFEFDIQMQVTGFTVKIDGKPAYTVNGDRFTSQVMQAINSVPVNSEVVIRDIKYRFVNASNIPPKEPTPIIITII